MNEYETRARAAKIFKLVDAAKRANRTMCAYWTAWPDDQDEGLRSLAKLLAGPESEPLWDVIVKAAGVNRPSDATKKATVVSALLACTTVDDPSDGIPNS